MMTKNNALHQLKNIVRYKNIFRTLLSTKNSGSSVSGVESIAANANENSLIMESLSCGLHYPFLVVNSHYHRCHSLKTIITKNNAFH